MPYYGHSLEFGTFLTPLAAGPDSIVLLAQHTESLGLDLVSVQDHPYQPAHLELWTLLSWIAGKTTHIKLVPNVLNLPLRPPAMVARATTSLDLLSSGRTELGLGAGAYAAARVAMGGPARTPAESVDALSESIDLLRALWDAGEQTSLAFHGDIYQLEGAARGPLPHHTIPILIGGQKPRMLQLIGAKADGWLVSLGYLQPDEFRRSNSIIDESAIAADRDPTEIRRLINISGEFRSANDGFLRGPAHQWVEELLPYVIEDGAGTIILMSDDAATIETFATDVAPALRASVARETSDRPPIVPARPLHVRTRRMPGIAYDAIPSSLRESAVEPGDSAYARIRSNYLRGGSPGLILRPSTSVEVADSIAFARKHRDVPLSVRSRGHGISGRSTNDGGLIIDLRRMQQMEVLDAEKRRVRLGPGARWMDVAAFLEPHGWALSSGDYGGVGVGGLATAGGVGWMVREHGLTIDHLRSVEMVLADGSIVEASDTVNQDLFWAVRGAGANFGIATSFDFEVDNVGRVGWAQLVLDASNIAVFLEQWGNWIEQSPRDTTCFLIIGAPRRDQLVFASLMAMIDADDPDTILARLQPLADIARVLRQQVVITSYASVMANAQGEDHYGQGEPLVRSGLLRHITPEFAQDAERLILNRASYFFQIRSMGGAVGDVDSDATAFSNRHANFSVVAFGANPKRLNGFWDQMHDHFNGLYLSFETDQRPERLQEAFSPTTLARLRDLKQIYDPTNLFRDNFNVVQTVVPV